MALIKCKECQKEMSDTLEACPHCGFKVAKVTPPVQPTGSNTICASCGKSYYKNAGKCPYCKTINPNPVSPYAKANTNGETANVGLISSVVALITGIIRLIRKYPKHAAITIGVAGILIGGYISYDYIIHNTPTQNAATVYGSKLIKSLADVNAALEELNLQKAQSIAKGGIVSVSVPDANYFKINGVSTENDTKYFGGNFKKTYDELSKLAQQITLALDAVDLRKDIDKTKVTDARIIKAYNISLAVAKAKDKQDAVEAADRIAVKSKIESFIKYGGYLHEIKDKLVGRLNFKVTSSDFVKNDYGNNLRYKLIGSYEYKGRTYVVNCELEGAGTDGTYYYKVFVD
jgi:hypothetical protein